MNSEARLDSVVFQLTPTRTRYELILVAIGRTEKIASVLLNPFLNHLKTAQKQIAKEGYSIVLELNGRKSAAWFTKGRIERFVRFVSSPEVLERVSTIESEIVQIEEALTFQSNDNHGRNVEECWEKPTELMTANRTGFDGTADGAVVLYKPETCLSELSTSLPIQHGNSKVQLCRVLDARKSALQKEQGMAFARSVAAGFDMEHLPFLISFAEAFGASRLLEACLRFIELWKKKHETGQWLEFEVGEAMACKSEFATQSCPFGITSIESINHKNTSEAWNESHCQASLDRNGIVTTDDRLDVPLPPPSMCCKEEIPDKDSAHIHEYFQGHVQNPGFPHWHARPTDAQVYHPFSMHGLPYYWAYPRASNFFHPSYPQMNRPRYVPSKEKDLNSDDYKTAALENGLLGIPNLRSPSAMERTPTMETEHLEGQGHWEKRGKSAKSKKGAIIIQNINYINSNKYKESGSRSQSASDIEIDVSQDDAPNSKTQNPINYPRSNNMPASCGDGLQPHAMDDFRNVEVADGGNWQVFQRFLLRSNGETNGCSDKSSFSDGKDEHLEEEQRKILTDPILSSGQEIGRVTDIRMTESDVYSNRDVQKYIQISSDQITGNVVLHEGDGNGSSSVKKLNLYVADTDGKQQEYRRISSDEFMNYGLENKLDTDQIDDPLFENKCPRFGSSVRNSTPLVDESFVVTMRSLQDQVTDDNGVLLDLDSEPPPLLRRSEGSLGRVRCELIYEPDVVLSQEHRTHIPSTGFDPVIDCEMIPNRESGAQNINQKNALGEGVRKSDKDRKSKSIMSESIEKSKTEMAIRKGKPNKMSPRVEAQLRAERLRAFKADLQKQKKEKEEEELKRLEALKRQRQKRIAARSNPSTAPQMSSHQSKARLPVKSYLNFHRPSKFTDSEPTSFSPFQRNSLKATSLGHDDSRKSIKSTRLSGTGETGLGLSRSVSSLHEMKKDKNGLLPDFKTSLLQRRRLSEPKSFNSYSSTKKLLQNSLEKKKKLSDESTMAKKSAIITLDKAKTAALPQLRIRPLRCSPEADQLAMMNSTKEKDSSKVSLASGNVANGIDLISGSEDDNPFVEKTVLMVKSNTPYNVNVNKSWQEDSIIPECAPPWKTVPSLVAEIADQLTGASPIDEAASHQVSLECAKEELEKDIRHNCDEKSFEDPYKELSVEDSRTIGIENDLAPPVIHETASTSSKSVKARVSNHSESNSYSEVNKSSDKHRDKEILKGFRKLLAFGRKGHNSTASESEMAPDKYAANELIHDQSTTISSINGGRTLKNLISQDEASTEFTPPKVSRPFSLLSPFRSKTHMKKLAL